ncbi:DUF1513 domain-containing protein [Methylopila sp. 73B]|uniref:DUF1513 domain-containing protein n=1 Tax=Methylopila sp. 73B TaxID=1120792 RepID=UPI0003A93BEF|nr:DUF1513 domain-containing protein [Methylopila sp. 73B]
MPLTRRAALGGLGALALAGLGHGRAHASPDKRAFLSAARDGDGGYRIGGLDGALEARDGVAVPVRLHALSVRPDGAEAVAVGRRPGDLALVLDEAGDAMRSTFGASPGRRFAGHGAYAAGGRTFLTTEIDADTGEGWIVLRDVAGGYAPRAEWRSGGIGPHDVASLGGRIVVANGAKEPKTDPGIKSLGVTTARSNVALLDPSTGAVEAIAETEADLASLSLRHVVGTPNGGLLVAAQDTEAGARDRPLVARLEGARLRWFDADPDLLARLGGSVCSLAIDRSGRFAAASGPKGGAVVAFDLLTNAAVGAVAIPDVCGLAPTGEGRFVATSGLGEVALIAVREDGAAIVDRRASVLRWDNHLAGHAG